MSSANAEILKIVSKALLKREVDLSNANIQLKLVLDLTEKLNTFKQYLPDERKDEQELEGRAMFHSVRTLLHQLELRQVSLESTILTCEHQFRVLFDKEDLDKILTL